MTMPADETPSDETPVQGMPVLGTPVLGTPADETERVLAGRYRLGAVIGRGGMGAVWRARDELLNRDVAIKEIVWPAQLDPAERETARRRAVREAQLAARLSHPNVVGVYDILEEDGRPCIIMELVPFRSLRDAVAEDGPMSPAEAAQVGLSVLAALRAVHRAGTARPVCAPSRRQASGRRASRRQASGRRASPSATRPERDLTADSCDSATLDHTERFSHYDIARTGFFLVWMPPSCSWAGREITRVVPGQGTRIRYHSCHSTCDWVSLCP